MNNKTCTHAANFSFWQCVGRVSNKRNFHAHLHKPDNHHHSLMSSNPLSHSPLKCFTWKPEKIHKKRKRRLRLQCRSRLDPWSRFMYSCVRDVRDIQGFTFNWERAKKGVTAFRTRVLVSVEVAPVSADEPCCIWVIRGWSFAFTYFWMWVGEGPGAVSEDNQDNNDNDDSAT